MNMKSVNKLTGMNAKKIAVCFSAVLLIGMMLAVNVSAANANLTTIVEPITDLINSFMKPLIAIVVAVGGLYCVILGVKFAKAEEPQDREKAKTHLKNAIIGFVIIFVLILALNLLPGILEQWVNDSAGNDVIK